MTRRWTGFMELVMARSSVRRYSGRPVEREAIERCLESARLAPSACNSQPWRFVVIDDGPLRTRIAESVFSGIYSMNSFAGQAPVLVAVIRESSGVCATAGGWLRGVQYGLIDIGIACEHFILQAEEEGIGTCWLGWFNERALKKELGLKRRDRVEAVISMGYAPEEPAQTAPRSGRKMLDEIRSYNLDRRG